LAFVPTRKRASHLRADFNNRQWSELTMFCDLLLGKTQGVDTG
jgi:hypothetical protein